MGGMGPAATVDLFEKITNYSHAKKDQEHVHLVIDSNTNIPDRTAYITGSGANPIFEMVRSAIRLEMMGADYIVMACNTAHYFYDEISKYTRVPIINMINETAEYIVKAFPDSRSYLLLATEGTYLSGIYKNIFAEHKLDILEPDQKDKESVMNWIYKVKSGDFSVAPSEVETLISKYVRGCESTILGCTELPLLAKKIGAPKQYIDPVSILAQRCVEMAEENKGRPEKRENGRAYREEKRPE